jgi:16S rRNA A1518/A1519 N6-dimethyltransferase RsmA/KsgA/DIM1 with predicted DNA glycosylase/AP lyase activity
VDSAVILLRSRQIKRAQNSAVFYEAVRAIFAQPRKTVFNNLRQAFVARNLSAEAAERLLESADIDPGARPQDLSLEKIRDLADRMAST